MQASLFSYELQQRRLRIVAAITNIYLLIGVIALIGNASTLFSPLNDVLPPQVRLLNLAINFLIVLLAAYVRFKLMYQRLNLAFLLISVPMIVLALWIMYSTGTGTSMAFMLLVLSIVAAGIVTGVRSALVISILSGVAIALIFALQASGTVVYTPGDTSSTVFFTLILLFFLGLITYIGRIGYEETENSYQKAYDYAKRLEQLNKELDKKVKQRTKQLRLSFEQQADSIYSEAVMGSIAKAMLHDIVNPLSAIKGILGLLKSDPTDLETVEMGEVAVSQLIRIVENSRALMAGKNIVEDFYPAQILHQALLVIRHEMDTHDIALELDVEPKVKLSGAATIFERIVINLILNAIQELLVAGPEHSQKISIKGFKAGKFFELQIADNGRGIPEKHLADIFEPTFSLKGSTNLGFGLAFVKKYTEQSFKGSVKVDTSSKGTVFTLKFKLTPDAKKASGPKQGN